MDQSPYLVQALQQMQQSQPAAPQGPSLSPQQMAQVVKQKQAWEAANPGQSYIAHGFQQMGQNIMGAPQNVMSGLGRLAQTLPGMGPKTMAGIDPSTVAPY